MAAFFSELIEFAGEPSVLLVVLIVFVSGIVRGFSGFGSGMIIGPTAAALFSPAISLGMLTIVDVVPGIALFRSTYRDVNFREVLPVAFGFLLLMPLGVWLLKTGDPVALRWFVSISILIAVVILWSGWKYNGPRSRPVSVAVGGVGGFMGAAAALPGPAVLVYWLASAARAATVRANMVYYLIITDTFIIAGYLLGDVYSKAAIFLGIICLIPYLGGILLGARFFAGASDATYRNVAFTIILLAAVTSLPILDSVLR